VTAVTHQAEIDRRVDQFQNDLGELVRADERAMGPDRFFLYVGSVGLAGQVARALLRNEQNPEQGGLPIPILIGGESAAGKTALSREWAACLNSVGAESDPSVPGWSWAQHIGLDNYYRDNSDQRRVYNDLVDLYRNLDVDSPDSSNLALAARHLNLLSQGFSPVVSTHDFATGVTSPNAVKVPPARFILLEGLFALNEQLTGRLEDFPRLGVFVSTSPEELKQRWFRRLRRLAETADWVIPVSERPTYYGRVTVQAKRHVLPTKSAADMVLSGEAPPIYRQGQLVRLSELMIGALRPLDSN
jgi:uridine kinase